MKRKVPQRRTVLKLTEQETLAQQLLMLSADPRKKRFYMALLMALANLTADEMDRIEPHLVNNIGRRALHMNLVPA